MGFLDSLGDVAKKMGKAAIAGPGAIYDMATYAVPGDFLPGDRGYGDFSGLLNSLGNRGNDLKFAVPKPITTAFGDTMHAAYTVYHEAVDQPLSTAMVMASHIDTGKGETHYGDIFSADAWSQAYGVAEKQSIGQSITFAFKGGDTDPLAVDAATTPFADMEFTRDHPFLSNASALGTDLAVSWFLDPFAVAGKGAGIARQDHTLGRIRETARADFGARLDGSIVGAEKTFGVAQDWSGRFESFFNFIGGENKLGRPLTAAEIRASSVELQRSSGGLAISSALEDALKLEDANDRMNAARRVFAVAAGDTGQIARLAQEAAGTQALEWKLRNIVNQKTVDLQAQALDAARKDSPEFRALFNGQIDALDEGGDLTKFIGDWHNQVAAELSGQRNLLAANRSLSHMPAMHSGPMGSTHKLNVARGDDLLSKVEKKHDAVMDKIHLPSRDSFSTVYQQGLYSLPVLAVYPAKFMAALLPTKAVPKTVRGLRTVHYTGVVNLHDWDAASDQLNSMMIHAGVDNDVRIKHLSDVYKARTENERLAVIHRTEQVAMDGIAREMSAKHGVEINREYIQQAMLQGQESRGRATSAMNGSRMYSTTQMEGETLGRARTMRAARMESELDDKLAAERVQESLDNWKPTVDQYLDSTGTPYTMPVVSSQLANRVPLLDVPMVKQMTGDRAFAQRLARHGEEWADTATELSGLQAKLARATGSQYDRIQRQILNVRKTQDALLSAASAFNRWWKVGVLFRLGYPMRVLADDHMRIAARIGYIPFLMSNTPEGIKNAYHNHLPGFLPGTRRNDAVRAYEATKARRNQMVAHYGRKEAHTDDEWTELTEAHKVFFGKATAEEKAVARRAIDRLDPDGRITEYADLTRQASTLRRSIGQLRRNGNAAALADAEGALAHVTEQLAGRFDPGELRNEIGRLNEQLRGTLGSRGPKNFREPKRHIGEADVRLGDGNKVGGAFSTPAQGWYEATGSKHSFDYILTDGEEMGFRLNSSGHWRSVAPGEPGYYHLWANILNHQFQHSPEFMSIIRGEVTTPAEYAAWLGKSENRHIVERMQYYAHDAEDWGGRLLAMSADYAPTAELRNLMKQGRVSARQLKRLFPDGDARLPNLHGQLADIQSGRQGAVRMFSDGIQRAFSYLAEKPTDQLSRHPFFNAIYKREVKQAYAAIVAERGVKGFTDADRALIESIARKNALGELKQTLWDVSAHSHAGHTMRFLSPFFAAHQEALNRWWNIVKDDPSVARKFQLAFDAPRKAGLTYNADTGEVVEPGDAIGGPGNKIMLKLPFADDNNAVNKWLKKLGGGKNWEVNENGFNLILQNGILNPGVGPVVTVPVETLVQKFPEATEFEKVARAINQYPPSGDGFVDVALGATIPAWSKRMVSYFQGPKSEEFGRYYMQNFADNLTTFRLQYDREPTENELKGLQDKANKETHRDLVVMALSNALAITPAKPNSKYALVQNGLQRLYDQMRAEGHDMEWLRDTFRAQYGDVYMAMIYSMGTNPGKLEGSVAEVSAIKRHRSLMKNIDPALARLAIGPDVEAADKADQLYSQSASSWLASQETGTPGTNFRGKKDPREAATALVVSQGWDQYDELINALDVMAEQQGLTSYEDSSDLVEAKRRGLDYIKAQNPVFAHAYDEYTHKSFDKLVDDMRLIASDRRLNSDPTRSNDIHWLGQYLQLRDAITGILNQRKAAGGARTIGAEGNADLAKAFFLGVQYINQQSPYFRQFAYAGVIERDPYLVASGGEQ